MYSNDTLYKADGWLKRPIKTVLDIIPCFKDYPQLRVLDLGCGVGRNCIGIAQHFQYISCVIDCVDILDLAIDKLNIYAAEYGVSQNINGIVKAIDDYPISPDYYDWILAVSALEHVDSKESFLKKLYEIKNGTRKNGIVCLVINSNVREFAKLNGSPLPAQFEVNLPTDELQEVLKHVFYGWNILKSTTQRQKYDIPRENMVSELITDVVTFVAKK